MESTVTSSNQPTSQDLSTLLNKPQKPLLKNNEILLELFLLNSNFEPPRKSNRNTSSLPHISSLTIEINENKDTNDMLLKEEDDILKVNEIMIVNVLLTSYRILLIKKSKRKTVIKQNKSKYYL